MADKSDETTHGANDSSATKDQSKFKQTKDEDFGYFFYPERDGVTTKPTFLQRVMKGRRAAERPICEKNVIWCADNHPIVKLMMRALKSHGCEVDLRRHVSCEPCNANVNGGFDNLTKQVIVCENTGTTRNVCCNVLAHEFLHAFDYCRAKVDFENLEHLACSEVRAANIMHCSFMAAWMAGDASPLNFKQRHQACVKKKALLSVLMVRNITEEKAMEVVDKVFDKCYNDMEPVGRRPRKDTRDAERSLIEGHQYGYSD